MSASSQRNVLITGIPRSGTTLVCSLLNKVPDVVALQATRDAPSERQRHLVLDLLEDDIGADLADAGKLGQ